MQIDDKIYGYLWRGRGNNCNSFLLKGKKTVLFDPGHIQNELRENCLDILSRELKADGIQLEDIELILCTHGHPDHIEAAGVIREQSGALLALHRQDEFIIDAMEQRYAAAGAGEMPSIKPDFYLQDGELELGLGETEQVTVIHTPGHSPGSVCFHLPGLNALITGDTVFQDSIGRSDLPGGDMNELGESVARLARLDSVELLLPGHMGFIRGAENVSRNFDRIKTFFFG